MANYTQNLILETFENMLERMPFEKITVTALIKECNIGRNTFYYHYEDIYALLEDALIKSLGQYEDIIKTENWQEALKSLLYACRDNRKKVNNIFNSISRDRLERFIFGRTDNAITYQVQKLSETRNVAPERAKAVADIVRYSVYGFLFHYLWSGMKEDIEESVDQIGAVCETLLDTMLN